MSYYIGIMSGTSLDGIDSVIISFDDKKPLLIQTNSIDFPEDIKNKLSNLVISGVGNLKDIGILDVQLGQLYAYACDQIMHKANLNAHDITAIGCHGQNIYHKPNLPYPFTWQLGSLSVIARTTQITTVGDFRSLDIAYGGQGAPLAPAFHHAVFASNDTKRVILNLGGIANISCLGLAQNKIIGFDTGPANTLLDLWYQKNHTESNKSFDENGLWASYGTINHELLELMLSDPYFEKNYPKSTGREYFNLAWLEKYLNHYDNKIPPEDIQATLSQLTAKTVADAIKNTQPDTKDIYIAGGGSNNMDLIERIKNELNPIKVDTTDVLGIAPQWLEASLIAWLTMRRLQHKVSNLPSVTGASKELSLGTIYLPN